MLENNLSFEEEIERIFRVFKEEILEAQEAIENLITFIIEYKVNGKLY